MGNYPRLRGPAEFWPVLTVAWYDEYLSKLLEEAYVPPDVLKCLVGMMRLTGDRTPPKKILAKLTLLRDSFNPRSGHKRQERQTGHKKAHKNRRPGRRRPR